VKEEENKIEEDEENLEELENEEKIDEEEESLKNALAVAIRAPQRGDLEEILASNLAAAVFAQPLEKIRMIFEAFLLLPEEDQILIVENEEEIQYIKMLYEVVISLCNAFEVEPPISMRGRFGIIPWSFSITEADKYLSLFINRIWEFAQGDEWREFFDNLKNAKIFSMEGETLWNIYLQELARFLCSGFAPLSLIEQIKTEYIIKIMPYASYLLREIFKNYISKETWETMLSILGGKSKPKP
jgi:hypothetical protein